jgi:hypothetical protein
MTEGDPVLFMKPLRVRPAMADRADHALQDFPRQGRALS